jgi:hypothetical protein
MLNKKFIVESVDIKNGFVNVKYINPYGPIETGEKTPEDFVIVHNVHRGNFDNFGNPLYEEQKEYISNPNQDLNMSVMIDFENENYICAEKILTNIMKNFPLEHFERELKLKKAEQNYKGDIEKYLGMVFDSNDIVIVKPHEEMLSSVIIGEKEWIKENSNENIH